MKKMKRLVAVLLAGVLALAMLTACGSTPDAPVVRDEALEKDVAQWTVELGKDYRMDLTVDETLTAISLTCMPYLVKGYDASRVQDYPAVKKALAEWNAALAKAANGKKVITLNVAFNDGLEINKKALAEYVHANEDAYRAQLKEAGITKLTKFGVTVTKQKGYKLISIIVA